MLKKILLTLLVFLCLAAIILIATGHSYIITAMQRTYLQGEVTANINDHTAFNTNLIKTDSPQELPVSESNYQADLPDTFRSYHEAIGTAAYVVVKDGEIISEHYMNGYDARSKTNAFSMAKTVVTLLVGIAIEEGYLESLEQKLTDFLPEFINDPLAANATIGQLSSMTSGYEWTEHYYSPFSPTVELLYGDDVEGFLLSGYFSAEPGSSYEYSSASTQLLGIILKRALREKGNTQTISEYLSEKIWQPLQMNDDALWHTDEKNMELVFCCISSNARNFAKLGMLMLQQGKWQNQQIVTNEFIQLITTPTPTSFYGYSTWINYQSEPNYFWFSGHLGQYIIAIPEHNMVIVRLGEQRESDTDFRTNDIPYLIDTALTLGKIKT